MLPKRVELLVVLMAAWRLGAAATPVNPTFTGAVEAEYQIADADAVLVVNGGPDTPDRRSSVDRGSTRWPRPSLRGPTRGLHGRAGK